MAQSAAKRVYELLVVNTVQHAMDLKRLVGGVVASLVGVLFGLGAYRFFQDLAWGYAQGISLLGVYAYMTLLLYHYITYKQEKHDKRQMVITRVLNRMTAAIGAIVFVTSLLLLINQAITVTGLVQSYGYVSGALLVEGIAGLLVLVLPLFAWEWVAAKTPVDTWVKKVLD